MKRQTRRIDTQLAVIGTGVAGLAASLFARAQGTEVAQFGHSGALAYTTGYLDLLGAHEGKALADPWAGLDGLGPDHPLSRLDPGDLRVAVTDFAAALTAMGLAYTVPCEKNLRALLPTGQVKPTLSVPQTMLPGIKARAAGTPALIVDFHGLQGFSAEEFRINSGWPGLRTARIGFPGHEDRQVFPEVMARALETHGAQDELADLLRPLIGEVTHVGLPAILGMHAPDKVRAAMEDRLGVTLFEIPTMPPAVPGIRLREMMERELPGRGVQLEPALKVARAEVRGDGVTLHLSGPMDDLEVRAQAAILATGRFLSGGLKAERDRVAETLLDLPIAQPDSRAEWHRDAYFDPRGHPINQLGVATDADFRPLATDGRPVSPRLFAAGSVLAGQDWVRERAGAGIAIASAFGAVRAAARTQGV